MAVYGVQVTRIGGEVIPERLPDNHGPVREHVAGERDPDEGLGPLMTFRLAIAGALTSAALVLASAAPGLADERREDARFEQCLDGVLTGFASGLEERACQGYYDLPSAYHFYCAQRVRTGFKTPLERDACVRFFEGEALKAMRAYVTME
ncbi:MAG: hypothetical protein AAFX39_15155 [Pseudomonadota bacterium]